VNDGWVTFETQNVSSVGEGVLKAPELNVATPEPFVADDDVFTGGLLFTYQSPVTVAEPTGLPLASRRRCDHWNSAHDEDRCRPAGLARREALSSVAPISA
jgi:hypothetical protein